MKQSFAEKVKILLCNVCNVVNAWQALKIATYPAFVFFLQVDFANQESQMAFYRSMQASGQDIRDFYDILTERRFV